ncbi:hypothetical protein WME75_11215 [Sorangium sp. So ce1014]|uniref:hypothetical protein n=1 Tax=Sorangium sp. So ce1014 TaxID=3133326 RepID=UPI003F607CDE
MRHWRGLMGITAVIAGAAMVPGMGCVFGVDYNDCAEYPGAACGGGTGGSGGEEPPDPCEGDPRKDPSVVSDACGVFAQAGAGEGEGTRQRPYGSLQEAIEKAAAEGKRVYACAEGEKAFEESVKVEAGIEVLGRFTCTEWTLEEGKKSGIAGPADAVALTIGEGGDGARVEGFAIRAADAKQAGGSSIGVVVAAVEAELVDVEVTAGNGIDGTRGATPEEAPLAGASAEAGSASNACVADNAVLGGTGGVTSCEDGETAGGSGGLGGITETDEGNGQVGKDGGPVPEENPFGDGLGGVGQTDLSDPGGRCGQGSNGRDGTAGPPGTGGTGVTLALTGTSGGDGAPGTIGGRGQGGGGGGGAKAGLFCKVGPDTVDGVGASGGGGGAGGCGGKGGGGGQAGGSSLGIVSLGNQLKLTGVTIAVGKGGNGGAGAAGQNGATGGNGALGGTASTTPPSKAGCDGGKGGAGGPGGAGGGGRGGYAVGLAYAVTPSEAPAVQFAAGTPGTGGDAGPGGAPENAGALGSAGSCWDFATQSPCGG